MGDDNVRFVLFLIMAILVAVALFGFFLFMSNIHIG